MAIPSNFYSDVIFNTSRGRTIEKDTDQLLSRQNMKQHLLQGAMFVLEYLKIELLMGNKLIWKLI